MKIVFTFLFLTSAFASWSMAQVDCPSVSVSGPSGPSRPGETVIYVAKVGNGITPSSLRYLWSSSIGQIVSGQGASEVKVQLPKGANNLTVTVNVSGLPDGCNGTASEASIWDPAPEATKLYEFAGRVTKLRVKNLNLVTQQAAKNHPNARIYIMISGTVRNTTTSVKTKMNVLRKYFSPPGGYDPPRITFVETDKKTDLITIWSVPAGANNPVP